MIHLTIETLNGIQEVSAETWEGLSERLWPGDGLNTFTNSREAFYTRLREYLAGTEHAMSLTGDVPPPTIPEPTPEEEYDYGYEPPYEPELEHGGRDFDSCDYDAEVPSSGVEHPQEPEPELSEQPSDPVLEDPETGSGESVHPE